MTAKPADIERNVARHYGRGDLEQAILSALAASGKDPDKLVPADLSPVDEFHSAGKQATVELAAQMAVAPGAHLLDVGCGIGGPSRYFAEVHKCRVTGIDLTADYVRTAEALARRVGLADRVSYRQASALALPFEAASFDGGYMMHVGMNIADKPKLFAEVRRVLKRGGTFAVYDVMRGEGGAEIGYPVHWAASAETSFVAAPAAYRTALEEAGFEVRAVRDYSALAGKAFQEAKARIAESGLPPLGIHILMKTDFDKKFANVVKGLQARAIAPTAIICRAR